MSFGDCSFIGGHIGKTWKKVMKMHKHTKIIPSGANTRGKRAHKVNPTRPKLDQTPEDATLV